jgi:anti-sigma28 factor (negative regulator of flagellin synthesis)
MALSWGDPQPQFPSCPLTYPAGPEINLFGESADRVVCGLAQPISFQVKTLMKNSQVTALSPLRERRQFGRIKVCEPRICQVSLPQSRELWSDQGTLVNISLGGMYFVCERKPPLKKNDIRFFSFDRVGPELDDYHLGFRVLVVRTEYQQLNSPQFGVALKIISDPIYYQFNQSDNRKITSLDKPRLMYQYYNLNRKAHEIITNTSEIRDDKIDNIKKYLDKGAYQIKSGAVTQRIMNNLLLEKKLHLKI